MAKDLGEIFRESTAPASTAVAPAPSPQAPAETPSAPQAAETAAASTPAVEQPKGESAPAQPEIESGEESPDRARDEKGRFVPLVALQEERTKRQDEQKRARELETELAQLKGRLETLSQFVPAQQQRQDTAVDPAEAESNEYYRDPVAWSKRQLESGLLQAGVVFARSQHADYEEVIASVQKAAATAPYLEAQIMAAPPAQRALVAYQIGKQYMKAASYGSVEEMEAKIRADERAKVTEELRKQNALTAAENVPKTVAAARGNGAETKPVWSGPKPLESIFPGY